MDIRNDSAVLLETVRGYQAISLADELYRRRCLFLTEEVDAESANRLLKQLLLLETENPGEDITLYINSPGGDVYSGLAVYDMLTNMPCRVRTVCIGTAASMGAILFLAGEERVMLPHSQVMIHDPAYGGGDLGGRKPLELREKLDSLMQTRELLCGIIAERTGRSLDEIRERTGKDSYFNAQEAVEFGLATKIRFRKDGIE